MRLLLNNCIELTLDEALQLLGGYGRGAAALGNHNSVVSMVTTPRLLCSVYTPQLLAGGVVLASLYRLVRMGAAREAARPRAKLAPAKQAPARAKQAATPARATPAKHAPAKQAPAPARAKQAPAKQAPKQVKPQVTRRPTIQGSGKRCMKKSHG